MAIDTIKRNKGKVYRVRVICNGIRKSKVFARYYDAVQFEKELKTDPLLLTKTRITFKEAAEEWLKNHSQIFKTLSGQMGDRYVLRAYVVPFLGKYKLNHISPEQIEQFILEFRRRGLKDSTIKRRLNVVSAIFNYFIRRRVLSYNPLTAIARLKINEQSYKYWSLKEVEEFLAHAKQKYAGTERHSIYLLYKVALHTGMRMGELLGLQWPQIDFKNNLITVSCVFCRFQKGVREFTKSGRIRHVPIDPSLCKELIEAHQTRPCEFVFQLNGNAVNDSNLRNRYFWPDIKEAGVPRIRFHDLRHTFASHFMMNGGNSYALQAILGHSSHKMTERYAHLSKSYLVDKSNIVRFGNSNVIVADFKKASGEDL